MKGLVRRVRGALGVGVAWGVAWFLAGMAMLLVLGPDAADVPFPIGFGFLGFLAGTLSGGVLSLTEGRRRFEEMSLPRFAGWGFVGGSLFGALFVTVTGLLGAASLDLLTMVPIFGVVGAASATAVLALARKAEEPELIESPEELDEVGLTDEERRELLGESHRG